MLHFATSNPTKFERTKKKFLEFGIEIEQVKLDIPEVKGDTDVSDIAREKVKMAFNLLKKPLFCNDFGCSIITLKGFPGINTAFALDTIGLAGIMKLMENKENRRAEMCFAVAFTDGKILKIFPAKVSGTIAKEISEKTQGKFGMNQIFIPEDCDKPITEYSEEDQHKLFFDKLGETSYKSFANWYKKEYL